MAMVGANWRQRFLAEGMLPYSQEELLKLTDRIDRNPRYLANWNDGDYRLRVDRMIRGVGGLGPLPRGVILELGAFKGAAKTTFERVFPQHAWQGVERTAYAESSVAGLHLDDVREWTKANPLPVALGWNSVSFWTRCPHSRKAAHEYLVENILPGGLLIDGDEWSFPWDLRFPGFKLISRIEGFTIWRKLA